MTKKLGLVLEGGGAKGSYHIGVLKALFEHGVQFTSVCGTSVGAINGAMIAQGDFDLLLELWKSLTPSKILDVNDEEIEKLMQKRGGGFVYFMKLVGSALKNRGLSFERAKAFFAEYINEEKIRQSPIDFGLVTVATSKKWVPVELFKEDIPEGGLLDYVLASAYFPAFKRSPINGETYIDGGLYDNLPINPLIRRGYTDILAIRTNSKMPIKKVIDKSVNVKYISPSQHLGKTLAFTNQSVTKNINLGYNDALKFLENNTI
jgi:NTE family protein